MAKFQPTIENMNTKTGKIIKSRLKAMRKTQGWLAEKADVSINAVSKWTKDGKISREKVAVVADALGITTDQLLAASPLVSVKSAEDTTLERLNADEKRILELYRSSTPDGQLMLLGAANATPKVEMASGRRPN